MNVKDIFFFENFLVPKIITVIYWIMLVGAVVAGIAAFMSTGGIAAPFVAALTLLGSAFLARIWCELMIVIFKIQASLRNIEKQKLGE